MRNIVKLMAVVLALGFSVNVFAHKQQKDANKPADQLTAAAEAANPANAAADAANDLRNQAQRQAAGQLPAPDADDLD